MTKVDASLKFPTKFSLIIPFFVLLIRATLLLVGFDEEPIAFMCFTKKSKVLISRKIKEYFQDELSAEQIISICQSQQSSINKDFRLGKLFSNTWKDFSLLCILIMLLNQLNGMNSIIFNSSKLFEADAGIGFSGWFLIINMISSFVLLYINYKGWSLYQLKFGGILIMAILFILCFFHKDHDFFWALLFFFVICFELTYASLPYVLMPSLVPDYGVIIGFLPHWIIALLLSMSSSLSDNFTLPSLHAIGSTETAIRIISGGCLFFFGLAYLLTMLLLRHIDKNPKKFATPYLYYT